jgi:hypothetical protein
VTARTPEGDALYQRVLAELDAEAVAEAIDALPAPRRAELAAAGSDHEPVPTGEAGGLEPVAGEVITLDVRAEVLPARRRRWAVLVPAVLAVGCLGTALACFPSARTEPVPGAAADPGARSDAVVRTGADRLTLQAQTALDRVLGRGHSVVTVNAEYADPTERWSERFGPTAVPTAQATVTATDGAGGYRYDGRMTDNGVDRSVEHVVGDGSRVTRLTVAVVVDAAMTPPPSVAAVRAWVGPAVGLQPRRGDQVSVLALPMASGRVVAPAPVTRVVQPAVRDYAASATAGLLALLLLGLAARAALAQARSTGRKASRQTTSGRK